MRTNTTDTRTNPAQANRWNAWRNPTDADIARGRHPEDPFWVGASLSQDEARRMIPMVDGERRGTLQWGRDGVTVNL